MRNEITFWVELCSFLVQCLKDSSSFMCWSLVLECQQSFFFQIFDDSFREAVLTCADTVGQTAKVLDKLGFAIHPVESVSHLLRQQSFQALFSVLKNFCVPWTDSKKGKVAKKMCQEAACVGKDSDSAFAWTCRHLIAFLLGVQFGTVFIARLEILKNQALSVSCVNFSAEWDEKPFWTILIPVKQINLCKNHQSSCCGVWKC